jgi:hypothetical protein
MKDYRVLLHQILSERFDEEELRTLCFYLGIKYEDRPGRGKTAKARELVAYLERHGLIPDCIEVGRRLRTDICWTPVQRALETVQQDTTDSLDVADPLGDSASWLSFFNSVLSDQRIVRAMRIEPYQDLYAGDLLLEDVVEELLGDAHCSCLVISGEAGSGKSAFLRRLVNHWAEVGQFEMQEAQRHREFGPPSGWIPIYFPLRAAAIPDEHSLSRALLHQTNRHAALWVDDSQTPGQFFKHPKLHWLLCLDGLDEVWDLGSQRELLTALRSFKRHHPRVKIILTTRPDVNVPSDFRKVEISVLSREQVLAYASSYIDKDYDAYEELITVLEVEPELWDLCAIPAYLEAAIGLLARTSPHDLEEVGHQFTDFSDDVAVTVESPASQDLTQPQTGIANLPKVEEESLILDQPIVDKVEQGSRREFEQAEDDSAGPLPGLLLYRMFTHLWKREEERRVLPAMDTGAWWDRTGELAMWMDGHRTRVRESKALEYLSDREGLQWILSLGVLRGRRNWFRFANQLTQSFFAAVFLEPFVKEGIIEEAQPYVDRCTERFRGRIQELLGQIIYEDSDVLFTEVNHEC